MKKIEKRPDLSLDERVSMPINERVEYRVGFDVLDREMKTPKILESLSTDLKPFHKRPIAPQGMDHFCREIYAECNDKNVFPILIAQIIDVRQKVMAAFAREFAGKTDNVFDVQVDAKKTMTFKSEKAKNAFLEKWKPEFQKMKENLSSKCHLYFGSLTARTASITIKGPWDDVKGLLEAPQKDLPTADSPGTYLNV